MSEYGFLRSEFENFRDLYVGFVPFEYEKSTFFQNSEALRKSFRKHISPVRIKCAILYLLITGWFGFLIKTSIYFSEL